MTEGFETQAHSDAVVKYLAEKGEAAIDQWQDTVDRARAMLASGEVLPPPDGIDPHRPPPYPWETSEQMMEGPYRIWLGSVSDYGTGEGISIYFFVEYAADEDEFRRSISTSSLSGLRGSLRSKNIILLFFVFGFSTGTARMSSRAAKPPACQ